MRIGALVLVLGITTVVSDADADSHTRHHRRKRSNNTLVAPPAPAPTPSPTASVPDRAVQCSCASTSSCPTLTSIAIAGYKTQPVYCNQLNGRENPGVHDRSSWYFQCVELANRWLHDSVGAPRIEGNADQLCDNADHRTFDVHRRGSSYEPTPGDLLVWRGYAMGHVGVVTSVSTSSILMANQNYGGNGVQYPILSVPRTGGFFGSPRGDAGLHPQCIIHPRKLPSVAPASGPCAHVRSADDGAYCGRSRQSSFTGGDENTLYTCTGGHTSSRRCAGACTEERAGTADHCDASTELTIE